MFVIRYLKKFGRHRCDDKVISIYNRIVICLSINIMHMMPCKAKMQLLLTLQVSRYCLFPLQSSIDCAYNLHV